MRVTLRRRDQSRTWKDGQVGRQWEGCSATTAACSIPAARQDFCRSGARMLQPHASRGTHVSIGNDGRSEPLHTTGKALALQPAEALLLTSPGPGLQRKSCGSPLHLHHLKWVQFGGQVPILRLKCPFQRKREEQLHCLFFFQRLKRSLIL